VAPVEPIELAPVPEVDDPQPEAPEFTPPTTEEQPLSVMDVVAGYLDVAATIERGIGPDVVAVEGLTHLFLGYADIGEQGECFFEEDPSDTLAVIDAEAPANMKVVVSVRTWTSDAFLDTATDEGVRQAFLVSCAELVDEYGLDGIDLAFPQLTGDAAVDDVVAPATAEPHTRLVADLRAVLGADAVLTVAPPAGELAATLFDLETIADEVDWVNVPAYDFTAGTTDETMLLAPITQPSIGLPRGAAHTVSSAIDELALQGLPYGKMVLGVSFRGRVYGDVERGVTNGMFQFYSADDGPVAYAEIAYTSGAGFVYEWDEEARAPWIYDIDSGLVFSFEDEVSVEAKRNFAGGLGLRGMVAFDLTADDTTHTLHRALAGQ